MKARVIETGEFVEVNIYCSTYYKEVGQGPDRRGWSEDELEFEPGPKMVSLDKICKWLENNMHMYNTEECIGDRKAFIKDLRKEFE